MLNQIELTKSVPQERWSEFFDQFSDGNRGRHISIEIINPELGDEELIQNTPLMAMVYDRPGKGNDLIIETGKNEVTYAHTVDSPTEVLTGQSESGRMLAVWISDATGTQTLVQLQPVEPLSLSSPEKTVVIASSDRLAPANQMNLKYICTRLNVENYADCKLFYQNVLGFKVSFANDAEEYAELDAGTTKITILNRARLEDYIDSIETATYDRRDAKIILTFAVPNLDDAIAQLEAYGVVIFSSPWQFPEEGLTGGFLTACVRDPDGNIIELEQILS
jgi:catechol 2,3-dioxygenase-like lactoylglutathione lyase family enzyme